MKTATSNTLLDSHFPCIPSPEPMLDFASGFYTVHDPGGEEIDPATIPVLFGSPVVSERLKGRPVYQRKSFRVGKARTAVQIVGNQLLIGGNPARVRGSNLSTMTPPEEAEKLWLSGLLVAMGLDGYALHLDRRTRLDITNQIDCETEERARATTLSLQLTWGSPRKRKSVVGSTVYLSQRSHGWAIKAYLSARKPRSGVAALKSWSPDIRHFLRIEVCLRGPELRAKGISQCSLAEIDLQEEFRAKLGLCRTTLGNLLTPAEPPEKLRKEHRDQYFKWVSGEDMKSVLPEATFHRTRNRLLRFGFDIRLRPNLAPEAAGKAHAWDNICHPSRWFASRFKLSDVMLARLRRRLNESRHHLFWEQVQVTSPEQDAKHQRIGNRKMRVRAPLPAA